MAIRLDGANVKALYRHGVACSHLGLWDEAKRDFDKVVEAEPNNTGAKRELQRVRKELKAQTQAERQLYSRSFEKPLYADKPDKGEVREPPPDASTSSAEGDDELVDGEVTFVCSGWAGRIPVA
eukprot:6260963-Prymnesium_polylepis.2